MFPSVARPSHTILRWWAKIKKRSSVLRTRKILRRRRWMKNHIDDGGRPEAAVNKGNELKHSHLSGRTLLKMGDTMVSVSSSCGIFYKSYASRCQVHDNDGSRQFITVKYLIDPPKMGRGWPDGLNDEDDYENQTMLDRPLLVNADTMMCLMLL